jgi:hypothetical protein
LAVPVADILHNLWDAAAAPTMTGSPATAGGTTGRMCGTTTAGGAP